MKGRRSPTQPTMNVNELADELDDAADEQGEIQNDRPTITVEYETRSGNTRSRTGDVWRVGGGSWKWDRVVRFSENAGDVNEDPYFIGFKNGSATLVSISERGSETELGEVENVSADGLNTSDDSDGGSGPLAAFDEPDDISEGMELTDDSGDVWLLKNINGGDTTVSVWSDGRRKRKEVLPTADIRTEYQSGELQIV